MDALYCSFLSLPPRVRIASCARLFPSSEEVALAHPLQNRAVISVTRRCHGRPLPYHHRVVEREAQEQHKQKYTTIIADTENVSDWRCCAVKYSHNAPSRCWKSMTTSCLMVTSGSTLLNGLAPGRRTRAASGKKVASPMQEPTAREQPWLDWVTSKMPPTKTTATITCPRSVRRCEEKRDQGLSTNVAVTISSS